METHSANILGNVKYQQLIYSTVHKSFIMFNTYQQIVNNF